MANLKGGMFKRILTLVGVIGVLASNHLNAWDEDEWLGDIEPQSSLAVRYGFESADDYLAGIDLQTPLFLYSNLQAFYVTTESEQENGKVAFDQYGAYWTSDELATLSLGLGYEFNGKHNRVEVSDLKAHVGLSADSWLFNIHYLNGDINLFREEVTADNSACGLLSGPSEINVNRNAWGLSAKYWGNAWGLQLGANNYRYERNVENPDLLLLVEPCFKPGVIDQIFQFADWDTSATASVNMQKLTVHAGVNHYKTFIDKEVITQSHLGLDYQLTKQYFIGGLLSYSNSDSSLYTELSTGVFW